jgi:hypothetical protein
MVGWLVVAGSLSVMSYLMVKIINHVKKTGAHISLDMDPMHMPVQEDTRDKATRKRVRKAIEQQWDAINARAYVRHDPSCKDPLTCTKDPCFIQESDKIVGKPIKVKNKRVARLEKEKEKNNASK